MQSHATSGKNWFSSVFAYWRGDLVKTPSLRSGNDSFRRSSESSGINGETPVAASFSAPRYCGLLLFKFLLPRNSSRFPLFRSVSSRSKSSRSNFLESFSTLAPISSAFTAASYVLSVALCGLSGIPRRGNLPLFPNPSFCRLVKFGWLIGCGGTPRETPGGQWDSYTSS